VRVLLDNFVGDPWKHTAGEDTSGQNLFVREIAQKLSFAGHIVDVATRATNMDDSIEILNKNLRILRFVAGPKTYLCRDKATEYLNQYVNELCSFVKEKQECYDIVHGNYWPSAATVLELSGTNCAHTSVFTFHSIGRLKTKSVNITNPTRDSLEMSVLRKADAIHAISSDDALLIFELYGKPRLLRKIFHGVNHSEFFYILKEKARQHLGWSLSDKILLFVGRFEPQKNLPAVLRVYDTLAHEALTTNAGLRLVICGGPSREPPTIDLLPLAIRNSFDMLKHKNGIEFMGRVPNSELRWFYTAADVLIANSVYEPGGLACLEAVSCGLPVAASNVGGLKETIIHGVNGLLSFTNDDNELVRNLRVLLSAVWQSERRRSEIASDAMRFSWDLTAKLLYDMYEEAHNKGTLQ
jgi:D-inositol-3-phosphate glycosyltransferase